MIFQGLITPKIPNVLPKPFFCICDFCQLRFSLFTIRFYCANSFRKKWTGPTKPCKFVSIDQTLNRHLIICDKSKSALAGEIRPLINQGLIIGDKSVKYLILGDQSVKYIRYEVSLEIDTGDRGTQEADILPLVSLFNLFWDAVNSVTYGSDTVGDKQCNFKIADGLNIYGGSRSWQCNMETDGANNTQEICKLLIEIVMAHACRRVPKTIVASWHCHPESFCA